MQYRTVTRLTDLRMAVSGFSGEKYLYCDTNTVLPVGTRVNTWGRPFKLYSSIAEEAVFLSTEADEALLKVLLARHDFVISMRSSDYATYQRSLESVLNDKFENFNAMYIEGSKIGDYILQACVTKNSSPDKKLPSWKMSLESMLDKAVKDNSYLKDQFLYLTRVPEDIAYILWTGFVGDGEINYHELDDSGSISKINLVEALKNTCTNFESTVEYGCITCEDRNGCLNYLSGGQLTADPDKGTSSLKQAKNLLIRKNLNYIPPSVVGSGYSAGVEGKLDFTGVNIALENVAESYEHHKLKHAKLKESAKFRKEHCENGCIKGRKGICITKGFAYSRWQDDHYVHYINKDYCTGAKEVEVTPDNVELYIRTIFELLVYNTGFNSTQYHYNSILSDKPFAATSMIMQWVFEGSYLDRCASACIRYIEECPRQHYPASVIPVEIEQALKSLELYSGFSNPREWSTHSMTNRHWVGSKTEDFEKCFPGIPSYSSNKWVVMTQPSTSGKLSSPEGRSWYGSAVAESIDTTLYASMHNLKVKGRKPLKRFVTIESRMHLALMAIKLYVSPAQKMWFGPFGAKTDFGPTALRANFYKKGLLADRHRYSWGYKPSKNPSTLSPTEIVLDILGDIANTPAKYNLHSLELLSSLGELVDK